MKSTKFVINPLTGRKIKKNGRLHKQLTTETQTRTIQEGGNPIIMALPTLTQLAIPAGLTLASHYAHDYFREQQGGSEDITNIMNNPILNQWIDENHVTHLSGETLIPIKVLIEIYNYYTGLGNTHTHKTIRQQLFDMVNEADLKKYLHDQQIRQLTLQTKIPFAALMGADVFKQLIHQRK